jgi:D-3-phosphoglycerate dehydrogenase
MSRVLIAVTDSPFPSLDPAVAALKRVDPELRMAKSASAEDILAVAHDANAVLVTYARLPAALLKQFTRCKVIGRFGSTTSIFRRQRGSASRSPMCRIIACTKFPTMP